MLSSVVTGPLQTIVIGQVTMVHIRDEFVLDAERCYVDTPRLGLVARTHGSGGYLRSGDYFQIDRPTWKEYIESKADRAKQSPA